MAPNARPTQHDIAKHLGVSQITVSRALSGHPSVTSKMRSRVEAAADELGYRPHASAAAMRRGKHNAFGLLTSTDPQNSNFPMDMMWFLHDAAAREGRRLVIGRLPPQRFADRRSLPQFLREWSVDGLIAHFPTPPSDAFLEILERNHLPMVSINSDIPHSIMPDDFGAGKKVAQRLIDLGHQKIAYAGPTKGHSSAIERLNGYSSAMRAAQLDEQIFDLDDWHKRYKIKDTPLAILNSNHRPTAIFCYNRWTALNFFLAAEQLGIHVPTDLSLICIDLGAFPEAGIDLSMEQIPFRELANLSIQQLIKIENNETPDPISPVSFSSHDGGSIAAPPN